MNATIRSFALAVRVRAPALWCVLGVSAACGNAVASPTAAAAPAVAPGATPPVAAPARPATMGYDGAIDHIRQRLVERLGQGASGRGASVRSVQVSNESTGGMEPLVGKGAAAAQAPARRPARGTSRRSAAASAQHAANAEHPASAPGHAGAAPAQALADASPAAGHALASASSATPVHGSPAHWSYDGQTGPESWASLDSGYGSCSSGERQSPIDVRGGIAVELEPIRFSYAPGAFSVRDNGHTVQANVAPGNTITVMGRTFTLRQFHFHRPSEESIDGRRFDMDIHLVHADEQGRLAVVAVLLEGGSVHPAIQAVWNNLPLERNVDQPASAPLDPTHLLPEDRLYYTYMGSLTTPPCSEDVLWMVMKQPMQISAAQQAVFAQLYPMNARPIQPAHGRLIKQSN